MVIYKHVFQIILLFTCLSIMLSSCERDLEGLDQPTNPTTADVFIDAFSGGLDFAAFGGSDVTAFSVDTEVKYQGTSSMRIAVPDFEDPKGAYAGGVYFTETGRDLSSYNVLTFWAKASKAANIDVVGFGNDLGENKYEASANGLPVNTNWRKYYIPIPDASKLTDERGLFYFSEGPEEERGYTIWFDEVKFENLGTIAHASASIEDGQFKTIEAETGNTYELNAVSIFNLPTGIDQVVATSPTYFTFTSSNPSVASVNDQGSVSVFDAGVALITAVLGELPADGTLRVISTGEPVRPLAPAPAPTIPAQDVISVFCNEYEDIPVDFYNGYWEFSTTDSEIVQVDGDDILRYTMLNFVGIQFTAPTIDITGMTRLHIDIWTPNATDPPNAFKVLLVDLGPDGTFDGGDNTSHELTFTSPTLVTEEWVSLDIPLSDFTGLTTKNRLAQIVLSGDLPNVFVDNLYFYDDGNPVDVSGPETAAPAPSKDPGDVISVYSDSYTNIAGTNFFPDWGQSNVVTEQQIMGNNFLQYSNLDYQGIELGSNLDVTEMEFLHIDYWTENSSSLNAFLISPGPSETAFSLPVPTSGWGSADIPLSAFAGVDLADLIQFKFDGNGTIYLDNIYFWKDGGGVIDEEPTTAAPDPTIPESNVISLFSDVYNNVPVDTWRTEWSMAVLEDITIDGNATKKYSELDFVGVETVNNQIDITDMTHFSVDVWSADFELFAVKLVDFGPDGIFDTGDETEHEVQFPMPLKGEWINFDIPLSDFIELTTYENISQIIFVGRPEFANTVYVDNVYFHN